MCLVLGLNVFDETLLHSTQFCGVFNHKIEIDFIYQLLLQTSYVIIFRNHCEELQEQECHPTVIS